MFNKRFKQVICETFNFNEHRSILWLWFYFALYCIDCFNLRIFQLHYNQSWKWSDLKFILILFRKLNQLRQEKVQLEHTLEQEQECLVNKLMRKIEKLETETSSKQTTLDQLRREKVQLENTLEQENNLSINVNGTKSSMMICCHACGIQIWTSGDYKYILEYQKVDFKCKKYRQNTF